MQLGVILVTLDEQEGPVHVGVIEGQVDPVQEGVLLVSLDPDEQSGPVHEGVTEVFEQVEPLQLLEHEESVQLGVTLVSLGEQVEPEQVRLVEHEESVQLGVTDGQVDPVQEGVLLVSLDPDGQSGPVHEGVTDEQLDPVQEGVAEEQVDPVQEGVTLVSLDEQVDPVHVGDTEEQVDPVQEGVTEGQLYPVQEDVELQEDVVEVTEEEGVEESQEEDESLGEEVVDDESLEEREVEVVVVGRLDGRHLDLVLHSRQASTTVTVFPPPSIKVLVVEGILVSEASGAALIGRASSSVELENPPRFMFQSIGPARTPGRSANVSFICY